MKNDLVKVIKCACHDLLKIDGILFSCKIEEDLDYDSRKLHEVCINHRFANYLEARFVEQFPEEKNLFFDIEFNREGVEKKELSYNGNIKVVRPDIIVHNRMSAHNKKNVLVVECKKIGASSTELNDDEGKIRAFMEEPNYRYCYGLQVIYGVNEILGYFFWVENSEISKLEIRVRQQNVQ